MTAYRSLAKKCFWHALLRLAIERNPRSEIECLIGQVKLEVPILIPACDEVIVSANRRSYCGDELSWYQNFLPVFMIEDNFYVDSGIFIKLIKGQLK